MAMPPATPFDYDELRAHYLFVLPYNEDDDLTNSREYGLTWQERMVKAYHTGLYKEYVLADLSRVREIGKVGLRWRTEGEVSCGRGFRCCGNLACRGGEVSEVNGAEQAAAAQYVGIGVPKNCGKEPLGMFLPPPVADEEDDDPLDWYLRYTSVIQVHEVFDEGKLSQEIYSMLEQRASY